MKIEQLSQEVNLEMVLIPAGSFSMGSPLNEEGRIDDETQHEVTLTHSYYIGKYPITQKQWIAIMGDDPENTLVQKTEHFRYSQGVNLISNQSGANDAINLPVNFISWDDSQEFIKKLNEKTNGGYRLPTEAEWEFACRAGTATAYSFGDTITPKDANYRDSKIGEPVAVGSYKPNAFGIYDMHGNVWEWCEDWKANYPASAVIDPKGPVTGESRVLRGGSFYGNGLLARSARRSSQRPPTWRKSLFNGLRLASITKDSVK